MKLLKSGHLIAYLFLLLGMNAWAGEPESVRFVTAGTTTHYRAVFAQFLAVVPNEDPSLMVDSAISISNVCAAPGDVQFLLGPGPTRGKISIYLYDRNGSLTTYETNSDQIGSGLNSDGTLTPGKTWTVRLAEVISAARGIPESEITFTGYGWFLSGFDCLAGTYSNTIFGLGFTQAYEMLPAMGQGGFFGGVMIPQD